MCLNTCCSRILISPRAQSIVKSKMECPDNIGYVVNGISHENSAILLAILYNFLILQLMNQSNLFDLISNVLLKSHIYCATIMLFKEF